MCKGWKPEERQDTSRSVQSECSRFTSSFDKNKIICTVRKEITYSILCKVKKYTFIKNDYKFVQ